MEVQKVQDLMNQATPVMNDFDELKDGVFNLFEKNSKEHEKFSKNIKALDKKLDEILEAQRKEKRKKEVKKFVEESALGFEVFVGRVEPNDSRIWIKIPNKDKTDFEYIIIADIPSIQDCYEIRIFSGKTYSSPFFRPRGSVLISCAYGKADGNGFIPFVSCKFWFNIDTHEVTPVGGDSSAVEEYFTMLEVVTGKSLYKIHKKIKKYMNCPKYTNLLTQKIISDKKDFYRWVDREEM